MRFKVSHQSLVLRVAASGGCRDRGARIAAGEVEAALRSRQSWAASLWAHRHLIHAVRQGRVCLWSDGALLLLHLKSFFHFDSATILMGRRTSPFKVWDLVKCFQHKNSRQYLHMLLQWYFLVSYTRKGCVLDHYHCSESSQVLMRGGGRKQRVGGRIIKTFFFN